MRHPFVMLFRRLFTVRSLIRCYVLLGSRLTFYSLPSIPLLIFHLRRENLYYYTRGFAGGHAGRRIA